MRLHVTKRHPEYQLPPPGTVMNKSALKRIQEINTKYNVNYSTTPRVFSKLEPQSQTDGPDGQTSYEIHSDIYKPALEAFNESNSTMDSMHTNQSEITVVHQMMHHSIPILVPHMIQHTSSPPDIKIHESMH